MLACKAVATEGGADTVPCDFCKHLGREDCLEGLQAAGIERLLTDTDPRQAVANARFTTKVLFPERLWTSP